VANDSALYGEYSGTWLGAYAGLEGNGGQDERGPGAGGSELESPYGGLWDDDPAKEAEPDVYYFLLPGPPTNAERKQGSSKCLSLVLIATLSCSAHPRKMGALGPSGLSSCTITT